MLSAYSPQSALEQQLVQQLQQRFATVHAFLLELQETEREDEEQEGKEEHLKNEEEKAGNDRGAKGETHHAQFRVPPAHEGKDTGMRTSSQASHKSGRQEMDPHTPQEKRKEKKNDNACRDKKEKKTHKRTEKGGEVSWSETGAAHSLLDRIQEHLTVLEKQYEVYVWPPAVTFTLASTSSSSSSCPHRTTSASTPHPSTPLSGRRGASRSRSRSHSSPRERRRRKGSRPSFDGSHSRSGTNSTRTSSRSRSTSRTPHHPDPTRPPVRSSEPPPPSPLQWRVLPHPLDPSANPSLFASSSASSSIPPLERVASQKDSSRPLPSRVDALLGHSSPPKTRAMHAGTSSWKPLQDGMGVEFGSGSTSHAQVAAYQRAWYEQLTSPFVPADPLTTTLPSTSASFSAAGAASSSRTGKGGTPPPPPPSSSSPFPPLHRRLAKEEEQLPLSFHPWYLSGAVRVPFPHDIERSKRRWEQELSAVEALHERHGPHLCDGVETCERLLQRCQCLFHAFSSSSSSPATAWRLPSAALAPPLSLPENRCGVPPRPSGTASPTSAFFPSNTTTATDTGSVGGAAVAEKDTNHEKGGLTDTTTSSSADSSCLQDAWVDVLQQWVSYDPQYTITLDSTSSSSPDTESAQTNGKKSTTNTATPAHRPHEDRIEDTSPVPIKISEKEKIVWERIASLSGNPLWEDTASPSSASRPLRPRRLEDVYYLCKENQERYRAMKLRWSSIKQDYMQAVSVANAYLSSITLQLDSIEEEKLMKKEEEEERKKRQEEEVMIVGNAV